MPGTDRGAIDFKPILEDHQHFAGVTAETALEEKADPPQFTALPRLRDPETGRAARIRTVREEEPPRPDFPSDFKVSRCPSVPDPISATPDPKKEVTDGIADA